MNDYKDNVAKKTGKILKARRLQLNLKMRETAEFLGKSISWVRDIEEGRTMMQWSDVKKIVDFYEIDIDWLDKETD